MISVEIQPIVEFSDSLNFSKNPLRSSSKRIRPGERDGGQDSGQLSVFFRFTRDILAAGHFSDDPVPSRE